MPKLSVNLVIKDGAKYLPYLLYSLKQQTYKDFEMIVVDNASTDDTMGIIRRELVTSGIPFREIINQENLGFAAGHNQAFKETTAPYFVLLNADMFLLPDTLEKVVSFLDSHPDTSSVAPRLMRWDYSKTAAATAGGADVLTAAAVGFTDQVDAIGIKLFRNRRAVELLTREIWGAGADNSVVKDLMNKSVTEAFGVSGAFAAYRRANIASVLLPGDNLFDPTYHSYKEDLDLAYRLRNAGHSAYIILDAVVYHDRTGAGPKEMGDVAAILNRRRQSSFVRFHSYKNHLRTLYKNEYWQNVLLDLPFIFWYEFKKFIFILFTDPKVIFLGWSDIMKHVSYTRAARRAIVGSRKLYWKGIRRWF